MEVDSPKGNDVRARRRGGGRSVVQGNTALLPIVRRRLEALIHPIRLFWAGGRAIGDGIRWTFSRRSQRTIEAVFDGRRSLFHHGGSGDRGLLTLTSLCVESRRLRIVVLGAAGVRHIPLEAKKCLMTG